MPFAGKSQGLLDLPTAPRLKSRPLGLQPGLLKSGAQARQWGAPVSQAVRTAEFLSVLEDPLGVGPARSDSEFISVSARASDGEGRLCWSRR